MSEMSYVNLKIKRPTRERLKEFGRYGDSYDDILNRLMNHEEERREGAVEAGKG